jgi:hypothetical protein
MDVPYRRSKGGTSELSPDIWYHVAAVVNGPTDMVLYLNGIDDGGIYGGSGGNLAYSSSGSSFIGSNSDVYSYFNGIINEVVIYDRALSASEIEDIYHCGVIADSNLVGYWDFEDGAGQVAGDGSGNGNDGQLGSDANADSSDPAWVESNVPGVTYHVDGAGGDNGNDGLRKDTAFETIQKGVNTAKDCDTVLVWPGVYNGPVYIVEKAITVKSGDEAAVIDGGFDDAVAFYSWEGKQAILKNFVIQNGFAGVYVYNGQPELTNLTIVDCYTGIEAEASAEPNISNCIFWGNDYDLYQCQARYSLVEEQISVPVAYWRLDGDANDSVGGNDGIIYGNPVWTSGQVGGALEFDGDGDYVNCGTTFAAVGGSTTKTLMAWVKSVTSEDGRVITLYRSPGNRCVSISAYGNPATWQGLYRKAGSATQWLDSGVYMADEWAHVALVQDGPNVNLYINGVSEISASDGIAPTISNPTNADIGGYWNGYGSFFDGSIDEVGIWDRALSAEEIERLYENGLAGRGLAVDPLFADANGGDYHLKSERGRYWVAEDVWVLDEVSSPCIDGGDPTVAPTAERMPNGGRVNMGAYGGTAYASMSEWAPVSDRNRDGIVNFEDYAVLADEWLKTVPWAQ